MQEQIQDAEIIQQVLQGSQQAYAMLVDRYQQYVFTLVLRYVPIREEAEEVAQDVFIKAYRYLKDFQGRSKFSTWLYTIVNTTCLSYLRKKKDVAVLVEEEKMDLAAAQYGWSETQQHRMDMKGDQQMIGQALTHLPETDARIITLYYQHEQTLEEIGAVVGLTPNNVKVKLFRARQKLKDILQPHYSR